MVSRRFCGRGGVIHDPTVRQNGDTDSETWKHSGDFCGASMQGLLPRVGHNCVDDEAEGVRKLRYGGKERGLPMLLKRA